MIDKETRKVIVHIDRKLPDAEIGASVNMYLPDGFLLEATPDTINLGSLTIRGNVLNVRKTGIAIGKSSGGAGIHLQKT